MKFAAVLIALFSALSTDAAPNNPISRVVNLLTDLSKKVEKELKEEENAFKKFSCWCKNSQAENAAAIKDSEATEQAAKNYENDLDSGRVELTDDRKNIEKEISETSNSIEQMDNTRTKEEQDYNMAEKEYTQAINALTTAIDTLATNAPCKDGFLQKKPALIKMHTHTQVGAAMKQLEEESSALAQAVQMGNKYLERGDAQFLSRILTGDVPNVDWKKLNRKAEFKGKYKARSCKIQKVLAELKQTFVNNRDAADTKEKKSIEEHKGLRASKEATKGKAQENLAKLDKENGARAAAKQKAQAEAAAAAADIAAREKFMGQAASACTEKRKEWDERKQIRTGEIEALNQAINVLHSDKARDTFKKSFSSQMYGFLQITSSEAKRDSKAAAVLRAAFSASGDARVASVAHLVQQHKGGAVIEGLDEVIKSIDQLVAVLNQEEADDLREKETCEKERMENTRTALLASREVDAQTNTIRALNKQLEDLAAKIAALKEKQAALTKELTDLGTQRQANELAWEESDKDDKDAANLVQQAIEIIKGFYESHWKGASEDVAGMDEAVNEATKKAGLETWDKTYVGSAKESGGVTSILTLAKEDIVKDREAGKQANELDKQEYLKVSGALTTALTTAGGEETVAVGEETTANQLKIDATSDRRTAALDLSNTKQLLEELTPACNYLLINFGMRKTNREAERDGLIKAKAILNGATFE